METSKSTPTPSRTLTRAQTQTQTPCPQLQAYQRRVWPWRAVYIVGIAIIVVLVILTFLELSTTPSPEFVGRVIELCLPHPRQTSGLPVPVMQTRRLLVSPISKFHNFGKLRHPVFCVKLYDVDRRGWVVLDPEMPTERPESKSQSQSQSQSESNKKLYRERFAFRSGGVEKEGRDPNPRPRARDASTFVILPVWANEGKCRVLFVRFCVAPCDKDKTGNKSNALPLPTSVSLHECTMSDHLLATTPNEFDTRLMRSNEKLDLVRPKFGDIRHLWGKRAETIFSFSH